MLIRNIDELEQEKGRLLHTDNLKAFAKVHSSGLDSSVVPSVSDIAGLFQYAKKGRAHGEDGISSDALSLAGDAKHQDRWFSTPSRTRRPLAIEPLPGRAPGCDRFSLLFPVMPSFGRVMPSTETPNFQDCLARAAYWP